MELLLHLFNSFQLGRVATQNEFCSLTVLDPENFARYNDGVIQAALLRAAHPSELDYSSHEETSRRMTDMLSGIFQLHEREQGEAALEFALALRCGRLKLSKSAMAHLGQTISENFKGRGEYFELLKRLA